MGVNGPGDYISVHPAELKFPFELRKQNSCSLQLTNRTDQCIAFKVKTTNPRKYSVRPNAGVIQPGSISNVTVNMQAPKEIPADMQCKDKFLIQSVVVPAGTTAKDINPQTFEKEDGKVVGDLKLRVAYIPAHPPSPVPEEPEEESSSMLGDEVKSSSESIARSLEESAGRASNSEEWPLISKLMEEKTLATEQNQKLYHELEKMRKEGGGNRAHRVSLLVVLLIGIMGVLIGYFIKMK